MGGGASTSNGDCDWNLAAKKRDEAKADPAVDELLGEIFTALDTNGDKTLDKKEIATMLQVFKNIGFLGIDEHSSVESFLAEFDGQQTEKATKAESDKDNALNMEELRGVFSQQGHTMAELQGIHDAITKYRAFAKSVVGTAAPSIYESGDKYVGSPSKNTADESKAPGPTQEDVTAAADYSSGGGIDWAVVTSVAEANPGNRCTKHLLAQREWADGLSDGDKAELWACVKTGIENPTSGLGCYAMRPDDYTKFHTFFDAVIRDYHKAEADAKHVNDWCLDGVEGLPEGGQLDLKDLGLEEVSMRVRVGRNLTSFPLPGAMTKEDRVNFEKAMLPAFQKLIDDPEYGGKINSMTPNEAFGGENPNLINQEQYQALVDAHVMFKDMAADSFLASAGIASDWPVGRGCWQSADGQCIIWFGEEDQLRIMCMKKGAILNEVFDRLKKMLDTVEGIVEGGFAKSDSYGYITSCPSNLGTGMRASVHVKIPNLTSDGTDAKAKEICKPLGLSVRGTGGEHTPIGADGTVDISPSARIFIKEAEIVTALYTGIKLLLVEEKKGGEC